MAAFVATPTAFEKWLAGACGEHELFVPQPVGHASHRFMRVGRGLSPTLFDSYAPTIAPPTKKLMPAQELLFTFKADSEGKIEIEPVEATGPRVLAGVRPCDLRAIHLLDRVFAEGVPETNYAGNRSATTLIALACRRPCDEYCFCDAVGALDWRDGADVMLTEVEEDLVLIEALTPKGIALLEGSAFTPCDSPAALIEQSRAARPDPFGRHFDRPIDEIVENLGRVWNSDIWSRSVERCFSCGTCNMVCPTCYCFDTKDELDMDARLGTRSRTWDGCMLPNFAEVAGGHNFRPDPADRQRHRVKRKFEYLSKRIGAGHFCVGCGRCGRQCTSGIDIFDIVNDLAPSECGK